MSSLPKFYLYTLVSIFTLATISSCQQSNEYDLAIADIILFDAASGQLHPHKTLLIRADTIAAIVDTDASFKATQIIDGEQRLACPGFVDTHVHLADITGDYDNAPQELHQDSLVIYEKRIRNEYLNYGVTTIRDAGLYEEWIDTILRWQLAPPPYFPNYFISGGALISDEEREPYRGHVEVQDSAEAAQKVQSYYDMGIRHIKLYWRLRDTEMQSAIQKAQSLGMNLCGHIDMNVVSIQDAMTYGLLHFEHAHTPFMSVYNGKKHWNGFKVDYEAYFDNFSWWTGMLEVIRYVDSKPELQAQLLQLYDDMAANGASLCTTTHLFGSIVYRTMHKTLMQTRTGDEERFDELSTRQLQRLEEDFDILMKYCKIAHDKGVRFRVGTDCMQGGKALLSELLLFYEAGFAMEDILQIATLNGAEAINQGDKMGSLEVGKLADIVLFQRNPFDDYQNLLSPKLIIKSGKVYNAQL